MKAGGLAELALDQVHKINGSVKEEKDDSSVIKVSTMLLNIFYDLLAEVCSGLCYLLLAYGNICTCIELFNNSLRTYRKRNP